MARSKSKSKTAPIVTPDSASSGSAGFYKKSGERLLFAPTAVHLPNRTSLLVSEHDKHTYPVEGWSYYETAEAAYAAEGLEMPAPVTRESIAEKIAARRAMTPEQREAERAQRDAERIARLQERDPERAAQLQKRLEERQERLARRAEMATMSREERRAAHEAHRAEKLAARKS